MNKLEKLNLLHTLYQIKLLGIEYCKVQDYIKDFDTTNSQSSSNQIALNSLDLVKKEVSNCSLCALSNSRNNSIFGFGNTNANLMFIDSHPNIYEDRTGVALSGNSCDILKKIIDGTFDFSYKDTYITNVVKCYPNNNRALSLEEVNLCRGYIDSQINLIKPKVIVTLGIESFNYLLEEEHDLDDVRGEIFDFKDSKLIPVIHPSYILRNPSKKKEMYKDMLRVKEQL